MSVLEWFKYH